MSDTCSKCKASLGLTCCELRRGDTPTFGVTLPEVNRIVKHAGMAVGKCFTVETLTWEEYQEFVSKSDVFSQIFAGQVRIRLNVETEQGSTLSSCVFLRKGIGCSLPEDVRPHTCRLYPFWFERTLVKGKGSVPTSLTVNSNTFHSVCYGRVVAKSEANRLFGLFDTTEESLLSVAAKMLRDAYVHARLVKSRSSPIALVLE